MNLEGSDGHPSSTCLRWQVRPPIHLLARKLSSGLVSEAPTISLHSLMRPKLWKSLDNKRIRLIRVSKILLAVVFRLFFFRSHCISLPIYSGFSIPKLRFHPSGLGFQEGSDLIKRLQLRGLVSVIKRVMVERRVSDKCGIVREWKVRNVWRLGGHWAVMIKA